MWALTSDRVGKWRMNHRGGGDSDNSPSASDSEISGSSSCSSEASNEHSKRAKRQMKRKYVEDSCDSSDTCEPKKRKKNQLGTKPKIVKKKRKSNKKRKSRKATERLSNRKGREKDVIYTALIRLDNNDSRIPVLFLLTFSCAASFAAFKDKVLEACGLASRKNVQFNYLYNVKPHGRHSRIS